MRKGIFGSLTALLASTGLALAQPAVTSPVATPPAVAAAGEAEANQAPDAPPPPTQDGPFPGYPAHPPLEPFDAPAANPSEAPMQWNSGGPKDECVPYCWYFDGEYLRWMMRGVPTPPLLTTGSPANLGVLGASDTQVLVGNNTFRNLDENGFRITLGMWMDCYTCLEATYFFVNEGSAVFFDQTTNSVLSRPFTDVTTGTQSVVSVAQPGLQNGSMQVSQDSQLWGGEVNVRRKHICDKHFNLDILTGLRYIELDESLAINETTVTQPGVPILGGLGAMDRDEFKTRNRFYAAQVGAEAEWDYGPLFVNARAKIALGAAQEEVAIRGSTVRTGPGTSSTPVPGGVLALPTNIGSHSQTRFSAAPECGINVGCLFTDRIRASIGYNFMYMTDVLRPGNQIDTGINPAQFTPGAFGNGAPVIPARPSFAFKEGDFWVHGFTVSVEIRF